MLARRERRHGGHGRVGPGPGEARRPGQERKPWVGERGRKMGVKAGLQNRGANEAHKVVMLNELTWRYKRDYKSDVERKND